MSVGEWFGQLDFQSAIELLAVILAALTCMVFHECAHGLVALWLGDPTAKNAGRLSLNPIRHVSLIGLVMMAVAKVGWAKPVPINPRYFKNPKVGMAVTAVAGPLCNLLMALIALAIEAFLLVPFADAPVGVWYYILCFLVDYVELVAMLCCGLVIFNLIPIPPLDGSKVLAMVLPSKVYGVWMRYEHLGMIVLVALVFALPRITDFSPIGYLQVELFNTLFDWITLPILHLFGLTI